MSHSRFLPAFALICLGMGALSGCGGGSKVVNEPAELQSLDDQQLEVDTIWTTDTGDGAGDYVTGYSMAFDGRHLYTASRDGVVVALDRESGERVWRAKTGTRVISGPAVGDNEVIVGTRDGQILALSSEDGSELWRADTSGEVLAPPAIGEGRVVAYSQDGRLAGFELATGDRRWTTQRSVPPLTLRGNASPVIYRDMVIAGMDNGRVIALDLVNGELRWEQRVAAPSGRSELERAVDIDAELLLVEDELYAGSQGGSLASLATSTGRVRWKRDINTRSGFAFDRNQVFTTDVVSTVWGMDRDSGAVTWQNDTLAYRNLSAPAMWKGYVVVGDYEGYLHWLIPEDGTVVARSRPLGDAIRIAPVVLNGRIYVLSSEGDVAAVEASFPEREVDRDASKDESEIDYGSEFELEPF
ncbi:MAG: outer membrane protein assembly factor BamB [Salinisphaeraceae bacterium]|nr:outer membrane protein assembly factor BamB [Salinisphaeraceae bacterium]